MGEKLLNQADGAKRDWVRRSNRGRRLMGLNSTMRVEPSCHRRVGKISFDSTCAAGEELLKGASAGPTLFRKPIMSSLPASAEVAGTSAYPSGAGLARLQTTYGTYRIPDTEMSGRFSVGIGLAERE